MMTTATLRQQVRATYDETNGVWLVAIGHYQTPDDDRDWTVDEYVNDGYDGYQEGRDLAESKAQTTSAMLALPLLPAYE